MNSLSTVLLPTAYLAPVSYYAHIKGSSVHTIEQHENYTKQSIRNRCTIYGANGPLSLTIPIHRPSGEKVLITDLEISNIDHWQRIHWQAIVSAYNSSPFWEYYEDYFKPLYEKPYTRLFEFNNDLHRIVIKLLKWKTEITFSNEYIQLDKEIDLRNTKNISLGIEPIEYYQVFAHKHGFQKEMSIIDLLCNEGPRTNEFVPITKPSSFVIRNS